MEDDTVERQLEQELARRGLTRQELLRGGAGTAASLGLAWLLAACGGGPSATTGAAGGSTAAAAAGAALERVPLGLGTRRSWLELRGSGPRYPPASAR